MGRASARRPRAARAPHRRARLADLRGAADPPRDRRRGVRRARRGARRLRRSGRRCIAPAAASCSPGPDRWRAIPPRSLRVLPKLRTPPNGTSLRSLSRYACVLGPGVEARWHKLPGRRAGPGAARQGRQLPAAAVAAAGARIRLPPARRARCTASPRSPSASSSSRRPSGSTWTSSIGCSSRHATRSAGQRRRPARERRRPERDRRARGAAGRHGVHGLIAGVRQRPERAGPVPEQLGPHRRLDRRPLGAHPPEQAPPLVARRGADLPIPPRRRAAPAHPLVGSDGGPAPIDPVHRGRRRRHARLTGLRGPRPDRRRRRRPPLRRPDHRRHPAARRTTTQLTLGRTLRQRPGRRPRLSRPDADLLRHGAALTAPRTQPRPSSRCGRTPAAAPARSRSNPAPRASCISASADRATRRSSDGRRPSRTAASSST